MREKLMMAIREHVAAEYPREACGLVIQSGNTQRYIPCRNVSATPEEQFTMSGEDQIAAMAQGDVLMVVHSHPDVAELIPSEYDRVRCDHSGYEWGIMSWPDGDWCVISPRTERDYTGRPWVLGHADCWSLVIDYYRREFGITLENFSVEREWWNQGENLYDDNWQSAGFAEVALAEMLPGDLILMRIGSRVVNHAAIYIGDNLMLHHNHSNLSTRVPYGDYWRTRTARIVRHRSRNA